MTSSGPPSTATSQTDGCRERVLDLDAVDVLGTAVDHVLLAVDQPDEALVVDPGQVAAVQPAVDEGLRGLLGLAPVAGDHLRAADQQIADPADRVDVGEVEVLRCSSRGRCAPGRSRAPARR